MKASFGTADIQDAVRGEPFGSAQDRLVEPCTALRQAQGERFRSYFQSNKQGALRTEGSLRLVKIDSVGAAESLGTYGIVWISTISEETT